MIVEKPLAHTVDEGAAARSQAAERSTAKIAVCFQNRYNTTAQAMHALLTSGDLGARARRLVRPWCGTAAPTTT